MYDDYEQPDINDPNRYLPIPAGSLSADALHGLLAEYASRDGTDYGEREVSLEARIAQLQRQLERGDIVIVFDVIEQVSNVVSKRDLQKAGVVL